MAVTLLAVVAALVIGHMAQPLAASVRHYDWYGTWLGWLDAQFPEDSVWRGRWGLAMALVPPLLVVGLFQLALREPLYGLAGLAFAIVVLFYAWGPRDLDIDVEAIINAGTAAERRDAMATLWPDGAPSVIDGGALVSAVFQNALRRWFGVLFWFLVLGPVGALLYRLTVISCEGGLARKLPAVETAQGARTLLKILDWPVAQMLALALALVGNFDTVLGAWREAGGASLSLDHRFLDTAARASVRIELAEEVADYADELGEQAGVAAATTTALPELPELRDAMSLVWRSLLVWLAVLALFIIAGFVS